MADKPRPIQISLWVIFTSPTGALTHRSTELAGAIFEGSFVDLSLRPIYLSVK